MRHPFVASALTLLLGSGIAYAETADPSTQQQQQTTSTQTQSNSQKQTSQTSMDKGQNVSHENVDLFFETSSSTLGDTATTDLKSLADWARCDTRNAIILEGSADPRGSQKYNMRLSGERAATVRQKLIDLGVPSQRIVVQVFGENRPGGSFAHRRRVTAAAAQTPVAPTDLAG